MKAIILPILLIMSNLNAQQDSLQTKKTDSLKINQIAEVIVMAKNPISQQFSVQKLSKLDIYFNPAASGDPLKAIATLPASTNVEETANPTLRGGSATRSRVYLNGSPVQNPVRFSRGDGLGDFSLFNTEILKNQWVYASNPPLSLGNSSAGIVELETNTELAENQTQIALALSNIGAMRSQKLGEKSFVQAYANYQFDRFFIPLNKSSLEHLNSFSTFDIGANIRLQMAENLSFNSFNYFTDEKYSVTDHFLNFSGEVLGAKKRFFSANNWDFLWGKTKIRWASLVDFSLMNFTMGSIHSAIKNFQIFNGLSFKTRIFSGLTAQYGVDFSKDEVRYDEMLPLYSFSFKPDNQQFKNYQNLGFHFVEPYFYTQYSVSPKIKISSAVRKNIFLHKDAENFVSYQFSANYKPNNAHRFLLSGGKYHSYNTPNFFVRNFNLLSSKQIALDYFFEGENWKFSTAFFHKIDEGDLRADNFANISKTTTYGNEFSVNWQISDRFSFDVSNIFLKQSYIIDNQIFNSNLNLKYFIKTQLIYRTPNFFTASLVLNTRPGNFFTPVIGGKYHLLSRDYEPIFGRWFSENLPFYTRIDFSANRVFFFGKKYLIVFTSVNNILNINNIQKYYYNENYSERLAKNFQKRIFYTGVMFQF